MKIVLSICHGAFGLSDAALEWMAARGHAQAQAALTAYRDQGSEFYEYEFPGAEDTFGCRDRHLTYTARNDPLLVACVEALWQKAAGASAHLEIRAVDELGGWRVATHDGREELRNTGDGPGVVLLTASELCASRAQEWLRSRLPPEELAAFLAHLRAA